MVLYIPALSTAAEPPLPFVETTPNNDVTITPIMTPTLPASWRLLVTSFALTTPQPVTLTLHLPQLSAKARLLYRREPTDAWQRIETYNSTTDWQIANVTTGEYAVVVGATQTSPSTAIVIDDLDVGFHQYGPTTNWHTVTVPNPNAYYQGHVYWTWNTTNTVENRAEWVPNPRLDGPYEVRVFVPGNYATTTHAIYKIHYTGQVTQRIINQDVYAAEWVSLGTYTFTKAISGYVELQDVTSEDYQSHRIRYDAMAFIPLHSHIYLPLVMRDYPLPSKEWSGMHMGNRIPQEGDDGEWSDTMLTPYDPVRGGIWPKLVVVQSRQLFNVTRYTDTCRIKSVSVLHWNLLNYLETIFQTDSNATLGKGFLMEKLTTNLNIVIPTVTTTPEWMYPAVEDIWELTPPPDWTPPVIPFEKRTPQPLVSEVSASHPTTPTFLPEQGIQLSSATQLSFSQWGLDVPYNFVLNDNFLAFLAYKSEKNLTLGLLNFDTSAMIAITSATQTSVEILYFSDTYLMWSEKQTDQQSKFYLYHLNIKDITVLPDDITKPIGVHNAIVLWHRHERTNAGDQIDIWGYDLETQEQIPIVQRPANQVGVGVTQDGVVYFDALNSNTQGIALNVFNINTQENINIGYLDDPLAYPPRYAIADAWIAWAKNSELHFYSVETQQVHTVTVKACPSPLKPWHELGYLDLSDNLIVLSCEQKMGYDITKDIFFSLPVHAISEPLLLTSWDLSNERLVWVMDKGTGNPTERQVYTARIEYEP